MSPIVSVADFRKRAQRRLPAVLFDYIDGGANDEVVLRDNTADLESIRLRQRVMRDVSQLSLHTKIFDRDLALPVILGPVGLAGMYARHGEIQGARASTASGVPFCLSMMSVCGIAEVTSGARVAPWFQIYPIKDRGYLAHLLETAKEQGTRVLVVTVDLPVPGARYREMRNGGLTSASFTRRMRTMLDGAVHPRWLWSVFVKGRPHTLGNLTAAIGNTASMSDFWGWIKLNFDPAFGWEDLTWVRDRWSGPILVKGILDSKDAELAVAMGADGIIVSNHGGRQLDGTISSARALPRIVEAVHDETVILVDGGIRSGLDILKMLSLGARACLLGRAWAFALAAGGQQGVQLMLDLLRDELTTAMSLAGCTDVRLASRELLALSR